MSSLLGMTTSIKKSPQFYGEKSYPIKGKVDLLADSLVECVDRSFQAGFNAHC